MEYKGKLYGKIGNKYFPTEMTSVDVDELIRNNAEWEEKTRWIPVEERSVKSNFRGYVNFKLDNFITCKKVDSVIEFINLVSVYGFTHWREIIEEQSL